MVRGSADLLPQVLPYTMMTRRSEALNQAHPTTATAVSPRQVNGIRKDPPGKFTELVQRASRKAVLTGTRWSSAVRRTWWRARGMQIGARVFLSSMYATWPHQVCIEADCTLEPDVYFKYDGTWHPGPSIRIGPNTFIGRGCEFNVSNDLQVGRDGLIASGRTFVDHNHGIDVKSPMCTQEPTMGPIQLEDDVWLGVNVTVLQGVRIGKGAVVGANAVVTKSIPPYEIWGGIPAKKIGERH